MLQYKGDRVDMQTVKRFQLETTTVLPLLNCVTKAIKYKADYFKLKLHLYVLLCVS